MSTYWMKKKYLPEIKEEYDNDIKVMLKGCLAVGKKGKLRDFCLCRKMWEKCGIFIRKREFL